MTKEIGWDKPVPDPYMPSRKETRKWLRDKRPKKFPEGRKIPRKKVKKAQERLRIKQWRQSLPVKHDLVVTSPEASWRVVYGQRAVGGLISFMQQSTNAKSLYMMTNLCAHFFEEISEIYCDENQLTISTLSDGGTTSAWATGATDPEGSTISEYADKFFAAVNFGNAPDDYASQELRSALPTYWTTLHKQTDIGSVMHKLVFQRVAFASGFPDLYYVIKGKNDIYDPRSGGSTGYTRNSALILADYLTDSRIGLGINYSNIDETLLETAADICDESVQYSATEYENRYSCDYAFSVDEEPETIITDILASMDGDLVFSEGKVKIYAGAYRAPTITLDESNFRSSPIIQTLQGQDLRVNGVKGSYVAEGYNYEIQNYPLIQNSTYLTEDNGHELWLELDFAAVTSPYQAQRLANIALEKSRRSVAFGAKFDLSAYELESVDPVSISLARYGWSSKVFQVLETDFIFMSDIALLCEMVLTETDSAIWSWNYATQQSNQHSSPSTSLPNPFIVQAPTGLTLSSGTSELYKRLDGTIFSRLKAEWTVTDGAVLEGGKIEAQYKLSSSSTWLEAANLDGSVSELYILDVQDGQNYDVRVRAVNSLRAVSPWATVLSHIVLGKTEPPSNVSNFTDTIQDYNVVLSWDAITDLDASEYELRYGGSSWGSSTLIAQVKATKYYWPVAPEGTYTVRIRAIDSTGNYSLADTTTSVTVVAPGSVQDLKAWQDNNNVQIDWTEPTTGSLLIDHYKVYKGETSDSAVFLGKKTGTFFMYLELVGGNYTYWVEPVDIAGNVGTRLSTDFFVYDPPDFKLQAEADVYVERMESENCAIGCEDTNLFDAKPADIDAATTLSAWFDTGHGATLETGDKISALEDQEGLINDFVQATDANRPVYGSESTGLNERPAMIFNGGQNIATTSTLGDFFAADEKMLLIPFRVDAIGSRQYLFTCAAGYFLIRIEPDGDLRIQNNDGSVTNVDIGPISADTNYLLHVTHNSGTIDVVLYDSSGVVDSDSFSSGNTANLTFAVHLGSTSGLSNFLDGKIAGVWAWDNYNLYELNLVKQMLKARYLYEPARLNLYSPYGQVTLPVDLEESWSEHFIDNSATDMQDLIDAGLVYYAQPTPSSAYIEAVIDLGATFSQSLISFYFSETVYNSNYTLATLVGYSADEETWTTQSGSQIHGTSFRYIKHRITLTNLSDDALITLDDYRYEVKVKQDYEEGVITVSDTTGSGEWVSLTKNWLDCEQPLVSMLGSSAKYCTAIFTDIPNPTGFYVMVRDADGNRATGDVKWRITGSLDGAFIGA